MTDKQIIDKCPISEKCKEFENCKIQNILQQLQAKEQECEELKKVNEEVCSENLKEIYELIKKNDLWRGIVNVVNEKLEEQLDQLKAEIEKLKEEKQGLIKDWEEKKNLGYEIACKNEKLKQTLAEIKEIAEEDCKQCFEIDGFSKPDDCGICPYNKILQKISEVLDD